MTAQSISPYDGPGFRDSGLRASAALLFGAAQVPEGFPAFLKVIDQTSTYSATSGSNRSNIQKEFNGSVTLDARYYFILQNIFLRITYGSATDPRTVDGNPPMIEIFRVGNGRAFQANLFAAGANSASNSQGITAPNLTTFHISNKEVAGFPPLIRGGLTNAVPLNIPFGIGETLQMRVTYIADNTVNSAGTFQIQTFVKGRYMLGGPDLLPSGTGSGSGG